MKIRFFPLILLLLMLGLPTFAQAGGGEPDRLVRVGAVKNSPYVESLEDGLAVDLWEEVSRRAHLDSEMVMIDDLDQALEELRAGRIQAIVGALPAEPDLAEGGILSLPYADQTLGLMSISSNPTPWGLLRPLLDTRILVLFGLLLGVAFVFGWIFWFFERHHDDTHFPDTPGKGVMQGMWFALITVTTVGYGDVVIKTTWGRLVASLLLILTIIVQVTLTAALASVLTVANMGMGPANSVSGLADQKIGVIGGGTAEEQLERNGATVKQYPDFDSALEALEHSEISGLAGPYFELHMLANAHPADKLQLANLQVMIGQMHFALDPELDRDISSVLVSVRREGVADRIQSQMLARARNEASK